jgi:hypothetical protein
MECTLQREVYDYIRGSNLRYEVLCSIAEGKPVGSAGSAGRQNRQRRQGGRLPLDCRPEVAVLSIHAQDAGLI